MNEIKLSQLFLDLFIEDADDTTSKEFESNCNKILKFITEKQKKYDEYFEDYTKHIVKTKYGTQTFDVPRGYYCQSKIIDIITNIKRGKLTKGKTYDFVYGFNENDQLICVRRNNKKECEFIKREENFEIGITFRRRNKISAITFCEFYNDGKIKRYSYYSRDSVEDKNLMLTDEFYSYNDNCVDVTRIQLKQTDFKFCNNEKFLNDVIFSPDKNIFAKEKYLFSEIDENNFQYVFKQLYPAILTEDRICCIKGRYPFK